MSASIRNVLVTRDAALTPSRIAWALGTPQDVTLQELRIEAFFPADDVSEACWRQSITGG